MASIAAIQKQIANLEKQALLLRKAETASLVAKLKATIARHGLTAEDLGLAGKPAKPAKHAAKPAATRLSTADKAAKGTQAGAKASVKTRTMRGPRKTAGVPRYQDPKTGKTWTGNGKAPGWIAGVTQRDAFLISGTPASTSVPTKAPKAARKTKADAAAPKATKAKRAAKSLRPDFGTVVRPAPSAALAPAPAPANATRPRRSAKVAATASVAPVTTDNSPPTPA